MIQTHKKKLIVSSVVILLPMLFGLLMWDRLPQQMTTHWGVDGTADGQSGKAFAVFFLPVFLLVMHWLCLWITSKDPKNKDQTRKVLGMVFWIMPVVSLFSNGVVYAVALDLQVDVMAIPMLLIGLTFLIIGNYLPKCRQNHTIGVRIKWTLANEENWNATHRFCGRVWVIGGLIMLLSCFLPETAILVVLLVGVPVMVALPIWYSYRYHKMQLAAGTAGEPEKAPMSKVSKAALWFTAVILAGVAVLCFTGNITPQFGEESLTLKATYWQDLTLDYDAIDSVEFRETDSGGVRTFGFGSARLAMGSFRNEEFGNYTRYSYVGRDACVVVRSGEKTLVIGLKDPAETKALYETLMDKIG